MSRVAVVGGGWRAQFFLRLASQISEEFELVGASARRPEVMERLTEQYGVPGYATPQELIVGAKPDFTVVAVPWEASPGVITDVVEAGGRVLGETPPAPDVAGLRELWERVGKTGRVQVAEQYLLMPGHAARLELVRSGALGVPTSAQVSSTHGYHAVSLLRGMLGLGLEDAVVRATRHTAPLLDPLTRDGWTGNTEPQPATQTIATLDFGDRMGLYDFTDNQWHNRLLHRRILVRGTRGELQDDSVIRMAGTETVVRSSLQRQQLGLDLNLDGFETEGITHDGQFLFRNPFMGHRLMDEEIAMASLMAATGAWANDEGPEPYPLREASHDAMLALAIEEAAATRMPVDTNAEEWRIAS